MCLTRPILKVKQRLFCKVIGIRVENAPEMKPLMYFVLKGSPNFQLQNSDLTVAVGNEYCCLEQILSETN